ncbi:hypothetical protein BZA05DRAFT_394781 [Tricharina praecox]|uniref:uncharacterized protein n=1 Tax=Tricharina praecox TaxID=43433 RepID=UPI00221ED0F6|nr:uncharacterized protein BZA05DRAFT_394781 [Tricharina praecox]KAI5853801.1 hypothetical protein BZA05DRAFT_394781 [Tricharina praecox]
MLNRTSVLAELMKTVTFGLDYPEFTQEDAEYQKAVNTRYYRGLTINGEKNADWLRDANSSHANSSHANSSHANSSHANYSHANSSHANSSHAVFRGEGGQRPAQVAAYHGALESLLWLQSDEPWKAVTTFISNDPTSKKARFLEQHGFVPHFENGLGLATNLLPHTCIQGWKDTMIRDTRAKAMTYFLSRPSAATARTDEGLTPALFAVQQSNRGAIEYLLEEGADFSTRDSDGRNILHLLFQLSANNEFIHQLTRRQLRGLLDQEESYIREYFCLLPTDVATAAWAQPGLSLVAATTRHPDATARSLDRRPRPRRNTPVRLPLPHLDVPRGGINTGQLGGQPRYPRARAWRPGLRNQAPARFTPGGCV